MNNDLISVAKLTELFSKKIDEERKTKLLWILAIVGAVAAVVVAAHYIYKFFAPDYMDDFEDEFGTPIRIFDNFVQIGYDIIPIMPGSLNHLKPKTKKTIIDITIKIKNNGWF